MNSNISNRQIKLCARQMLNGRYAVFSLMTILVTFANIGLTTLVERAFPNLSSMYNLILYTAASVITSVIFYLFYAGAVSIYLNFCTGKPYRISDILCMFQDNPENLAPYAVIQCILQTVLITGGLHFWGLYFRGTSRFSLVSMLIISIVALGWYIWLQLNLAMVIYIYCDNSSKQPLQLLQESLQLMHGHKMELFQLYLSFAVVYLLSVLSCGIGLIFAKPYLNTTLCLYYLKLTKKLRVKTEANSAEEPEEKKPEEMKEQSDEETAGTSAEKTSEETPESVPVENRTDTEE